MKRYLLPHDQQLPSLPADVVTSTRDNLTKMIKQIFNVL